MIYFQLDQTFIGERSLKIRDVLYVDSKKKQHFTFYGNAPRPWTSGAKVEGSFRKVPTLAQAFYQL